MFARAKVNNKKIIGGKKMKKFKRLIAICLVVAFMAAFAGCYMVSGQKMKNLKGTYKLTHYTRTPKHERKEGYTQKTTNYLEDADYMYEDYLIITGSGMDITFINRLTNLLT